MKYILLILIIISCSSNKKIADGDPCAKKFNLNSKISILDKNNNIFKRVPAFVLASGGYALDLIIYSSTTLVTSIPKVAICVPPEIVMKLPKTVVLIPFAALGVRTKYEQSEFFKECFNSYEAFSYTPEIGKKIEQITNIQSCDQAHKLAKPYIEYAQCHQERGVLSSRQKAKDSYQYLAEDKYFINCLPYKDIERYRNYKI